MTNKKEDIKAENKKETPKKSIPKKTVPKEQKYEANMIADSLGINKYDFFLICKEKQISKNDFITESELVELYNKIIRR